MLFVSIVCVFSQQDVTISKKQFKTEDKEGFKDAWKSVKLGNEQFVLGKGAYSLAKENYKKAFEYNSSNPELNYKLGVTLLLSDEPFIAKDYLEFAYQTKPEVSYDIKYFLGKAYHMVNDFDKAISFYTEYKTSLSKKNLKKIGYQLDLLIKQCNNGKILVNEPVRAIIDNAGTNINSKWEDYTPVVSANDSLFAFTSRREHTSKSKMHKSDYRYYETVYFSTKAGRDWGPARMLFSSKKVTENIAVTGISHDGNTLFLYKGSEGKGDIFYTTKNFKKGGWTKPKPLSGKINSSDKEGAAAITKEGDYMYFTSERKKGAGGMDIYISRKETNGKWGKPVNAGAINTPYNESSVSIHPNGKILYFASQGHNSMGGYDIFKCDIDESGNLSNVENVGYPINSSGDDQFYTPSVSGKIAYLSSIREYTVGGTDIYKVTILGKEKPYELGYNELNLIGAPGSDDNIFFDEGGKLDVVPAYELTGIITDAESGMTLTGTVQLIDGSSKKGLDKITSDAYGKYVMSIPDSGKYIIKALSNGYMPFSEEVYFTAMNMRQERNIALEKIKVGKKMIMKNIYFDFGTAKLKKESYEELDNIYLFLEGNPNTKIEIAGYTDNIGTIEGNKMISRLRAKACVNYLVNKGIDKKRLKYEGYGFLNPISHNHTEEGRKLNRRVEFKILEH